MGLEIPKIKIPNSISEHSDPGAKTGFEWLAGMYNAASSGALFLDNALI
jgi:hypothetical protein